MRSEGFCWLLAASTAYAQVAVACAVPGPSHGTIQQALDDAACASIELAAANYAESLRIARSLTITGAGSAATAIQGRIEIIGLAQVSLTGLSIRNGCPAPGLRVLDGADVTAADVKIAAAALPCPALSDTLFRNSFE